MRKFFEGSLGFCSSGEAASRRSGFKEQSWPPGVMKALVGRADSTAQSDTKICLTKALKCLGRARFLTLRVWQRALIKGGGAGDPPHQQA